MNIGATMNDLIRNNQRKFFNIETIVAILNNSFTDFNNQEDAYNLLDFLNNEVVNVDELDKTISMTKSNILSHYPNFNTFICNHPY